MLERALQGQGGVEPPRTAQKAAASPAAYGCQMDTPLRQCKLAKVLGREELKENISDFLLIWLLACYQVLT